MLSPPSTTVHSTGFLPLVPEEWRHLLSSTLIDLACHDCQLPIEGWAVDEATKAAEDSIPTEENPVCYRVVSVPPTTGGSFCGPPILKVSEQESLCSAPVGELRIGDIVQV